MQTNIQLPPALQQMNPIEEWLGPKDPIAERGKQWYIVAGIITLSFTVYGILTGAWTFSIVCVLIAGMEFLLRNHVAKTRRVVILKEGILYDETFIRFDEVEGFWMQRIEKSFDLHVLFKTGKTELRMQLPLEQGEHARYVLAQFTTELHNKSERLLDMFIRICKL